MVEVADGSRNYVNNVERGRRNITLATIDRFAGALGGRPPELMAG
jgi:transcriptional regulator with XRE-family HTH domain